MKSFHLNLFQNSFFSSIPLFQMLIISQDREATTSSPLLQQEQKRVPSKKTFDKTREKESIMTKNIEQYMRMRMCPTEDHEAHNISPEEKNEIELRG